ncbi:MAG: NgoFVII family restriction endonuclease, partial [Elusimicrobia bacterium]|nr:NgoFVII family restriction endonuclease [Elusimicrobiota bacterium]
MKLTNMELIISPWKNKFIEVVSKTKRELFISSPFIDVGAVKLLSNLIQKRSSVELSLITNLTTHTIVNKITDPKALIELYKQFNNVKISSLGKLHAKVYLIDGKIGIITSANLTIGGLINNFEYGVLINNRSVIRNVKED